MSSSRRDREPRPGRRTPFRDPKPLILIVCEGAKTEPKYFAGFIRDCHNPRVKIEIAPEHGVPKSLVEIAKKYKNAAASNARRERDDNLAYDSVWCVFDVDDHPHVEDAKQMARDNGIRLAISNPCFELWLLLHFRDNPGMQHRDKLRKLLEKHVSGYDKDVQYSTYAKGYPQAVTRAKRMDATADSEGDSGRNPTTIVYVLIEMFRGD